MTSSSGIKFWYQHDSSSPLIHISVGFKNVGSAHMPFEKKCVPEIYINTVFKGCGHYTKEKFSGALSDISAKLSGVSNNDHVFFFFTFPRIVLDESISLFKIMLLNPTFEPKEIEKIKNYFCYSIENYKDSPTSWCLTFLYPKILFEKNHPYSNSIGTAENLMKLTSQDIKNYQKKFIVKSNLELCIFGDVSENEAKKIADKIFGNLPQGKKAKDNVLDIDPTLDNNIRNYYLEGPQSYIVFALPNVSDNSDERYAAAILYRILGGSGIFKSRIINQLRTNSGLIYFGSTQKIHYAHSCWEAGILQTSNENVKQVISSVRNMIKDLRLNGISEKELLFAKNNIKGTFLVGLRTAEDLCNFYLVKKMEGYSPKVLEDFLKNINSVTLDQINNFAKKFLNESKIPFVVIGENQ